MTSIRTQVLDLGVRVSVRFPMVKNPGLLTRAEIEKITGWPTETFDRAQRAPNWPTPWATKRGEPVWCSTDVERFVENVWERYLPRKEKRVIGDWDYDQFYFAALDQLEFHAGVEVYAAQIEKMRSRAIEKMMIEQNELVDGEVWKYFDAFYRMVAMKLAHCAALEAIGKH